MTRLLAGFALAVAVVAVAFVATGCASPCNANCGSPTVTLRNPFQVDKEPATLAGERFRVIQQPMYLVPTMQPAQPESRAYNPCAPVDGGAAGGATRGYTVPGR